jgi:hypothetical protein
MTKQRFYPVFTMPKSLSAKIKPDSSDQTGIRVAGLNPVGHPIFVRLISEDLAGGFFFGFDFRTGLCNFTT